MGGVVLAMELASEIASVEDFCVEPVSVVRPRPSHVEVCRKDIRIIWNVTEHSSNKQILPAGGKNIKRREKI